MKMAETRLLRKGLYFSFGSCYGEKKPGKWSCKDLERELFVTKEKEKGFVFFLKKKTLRD